MGINGCLLDILELLLVWMNLTEFHLRATDRIERSNTKVKRRTTSIEDAAGDTPAICVFVLQIISRDTSGGKLNTFSAMDFTIKTGIFLRFGDVIDT